PKIRTMQIIRKLEQGPRGVYCGAMGFAGPGGQAVFNVPIRTLQRSNGERRWRFRVGSGIVWDSRASDEWQECTTKAAFLQTQPVELQLLESILWNGRYRYLREHIDRMKRSADYLSIRLTRRGLIRALRGAERTLSGAHKVRLLADRAGRISVEAQPVALPVGTSPQKAMLADEPIDEREPLLYHKTTYRPWYRSAMRRIAAGDCFDVIFINGHGAVTEGARSNVFVRIGGMLYTPPVTAGLLPGVLRRRLLERGACRERSLTIRELRTADALYCGNSVRGLVAVQLVESSGDGVS
ncbi:MAG: aminodeoxychorismate synthase, component I, partial [Chitinivibrionales bacterium]|nr:aminodeoxychorismate synthase, component I [Chitinivibrionales bacterium]